jgi:hypothetical protein
LYSPEASSLDRNSSSCADLTWYDANDYFRSRSILSAHDDPPFPSSASSTLEKTTANHRASASAVVDDDEEWRRRSQSCRELVWDSWGSPTGKPEWGMQAHELSQIKKLASFGLTGLSSDHRDAWVVDHHLVEMIENEVLDHT